MFEVESLQMRSDLDIIAARARVRNLARAVGFNTADQARISLATSSLAYFLDLGGQRTGQITLGYPEDDKTAGIQIICQVYYAGKNFSPEIVGSKEIEKLRWMVDALQIVTLSTQDVQITLTKLLSATARMQ